MKIRQVEAFRAIMASGTVTRAAEVLSVSQPAVSRLLSDLEKEIGFKLFRRQGRQIIPTREGLALYAKVDRAFIGLQEIESTATAIRTNRVGDLNIVTMPSLAARLLPELIAEFVELNPNIGLWLEVLPRSEVLRVVASGRYDIGVATGPVDEETLNAAPLCHLEAYCVLPANHNLSSKPAIKMRDLDGERFISLARDSLFRYTIDEMFSKSGVQCQNDIQARTADAIYGLVSKGIGISIVGPDMPIELETRQIVFKPLSPIFDIQIDLMTLAHETPSRLAQQFKIVALQKGLRIDKQDG